MEYEVYRDKSKKKQWRWRLWLTDKDKIANPGEGFDTMDECLEELNRVRNSRRALIYKLDKNKKPISRIIINSDGTWDEFPLSK